MLYTTNNYYPTSYIIYGDWVLKVYKPVSRRMVAELFVGRTMEG